MFRLSKLFIVVLSVAAIGLAVLVASGHLPYAAGVREALQRDVVERFQLLRQVEELAALERVQGARLVAAEPEVVRALSRSVSAGDSPDDEALADLRSALERARSGLRLTAGLDPEALLAVDANGRLLVAEGDATVLQDSLSPDSVHRLGGVSEALGRGIASDDLVTSSSGSYYTAVAPVADRFNQVVGAVVLGERLDGAHLRGLAVRVGAGLLVYQRGQVIASALSTEVARSEAERFLVDHGEPRRSGWLVAPSFDEVEVVEGVEASLGMAVARLREPADEAQSIPTQVLILVEGPAVPDNLPLWLWQSGQIDYRLPRVWMTAAIGFVVLLLGLVILQRDAKRMARRLATQYREAARESVRRHAAATEALQRALKRSSTQDTGPGPSVPSSHDPTLETAQAFPVSLLSEALAGRGDTDSHPVPQVGGLEDIEYIEQPGDLFESSELEVVETGDFELLGEDSAVEAVRLPGGYEEGAEQPGSDAADYSSDRPTAQRVDETDERLPNGVLALAETSEQPALTPIRADEPVEPTPQDESDYAFIEDDDLLTFELDDAIADQDEDEEEALISQDELEGTEPGAVALSRRSLSDEGSGSPEPSLPGFHPSDLEIGETAPATPTSALTKDPAEAPRHLDEVDSSSPRARYAPPPGWKPGRPAEPERGEAEPTDPAADVTAPGPMGEDDSQPQDEDDLRFELRGWLAAESRLPTKPKVQVPGLETEADEGEPAMDVATTEAEASSPGLQSGQAPRPEPEQPVPAGPPLGGSGSLKSALHRLKRLEQRRAETKSSEPGASRPPLLPELPNLPSPPKTAPKAAAPLGQSSPTQPQAASPPKGPPASQDEPTRRLDETLLPSMLTTGGTGRPESPSTDYQQLFDEFIEMRRECGEPVEGLSFDRFRDKMRASEQAVRQRFGCEIVRLEVYVKEGRASIKAVPLLTS